MSARRLCFVDATGGGLAALAAGVAGALGIEAHASTTSKIVKVPADVVEVLREIGADAPVAKPFTEAPSGAEVIHVGKGMPDGWDTWLLDQGDDLERLSAARIARDRIERRLDPRPIS